ncbi:MAG: DEAD/DEAH box helicase [Thalassospira sp.]|uniref:DEAD/DEAH box helicase n=1 Tax=Thalassospira sp. TaxID=1912094 RepID=UPI0032EE8910
MTEPEQNHSSSSSASRPPNAIDLTAGEERFRENTGADFAEAKEAMVDALLRFTEQRCTGEGPDGEIIFGARPSSRIVSAFLLPRYDQTGADDETSDIHISTMGIDLQIASNTPGTIAVEPSLSVYVRELPSWTELTDPRNDMMPRVQLSREARQSVEQRARHYIDERIATLPPMEDEQEEETERAGNALAQAESSYELSEVSEDAPAVPVSSDERGTIQANAESAERAEQAATQHQDRSRRRAEMRNERNAAIADIRREAFDRAFRELGIYIVDSNGQSERPVSSNDVEEAPRSELIEPSIEDALVSADPSEQETAPEAHEDGPPTASGALGALREGVGRIADQFAAPQPIPPKWRRWRLDLGSFSLDVQDEAAREQAIGSFADTLRIRLSETLTAWLVTDEGQRDAYRPGERILPGHFSDEASWNDYLTALRTRRPAVLDDIRPDISGVELIADLDPDFADPTRLNLRIALQNDSAMPGGRDPYACEHAIFQVALKVSLPHSLHKPLRLDRVKPSYRFRDWLEYPAMGLNCGVRQLDAESDVVAVRTTWSPRYYQPRIEPRSIDGVPTSYAELSDEASDPRLLFALPDEYDRWISQQDSLDVGENLDADLADQERQSHAEDIEAYRRESRYIREGISLLISSSEAYNELKNTTSNSPRRTELSRRAAPWIAWLRTNEAFRAYGGNRYTDWRLFQLAFILAHIPTLASRIPEYSTEFDPFRDELSASLLYFPTGGGKSEAFFGLLIFNLFFDRLRGKDRGVTSLVRYPLRLLTLQQARRLMRILVQAELVRLQRGIAGWPFEIGFWVGSGNTPNRSAQGFGGVPAVTVAAHADDSALLNPSEGASEQAKRERRRSARYKEALQSYDKLRKCPCCGETTGMRKFPLQHGRIGIVCFNDNDCDWNAANRPELHRVPLPFILTDDTIYQRAPSVVLGTIDKLALIGQHDRTINAIAGMFGAARYMDPQSRHLFTPRGTKALAKAEDDGWQRLRPAFSDGMAVFTDPFPSLIIQDEGHLLDESLGTFSGLFETTLESIFIRLGNGILGENVSRWPADAAAARPPRLAKVIAATATISDPDRQLRVLYQREPLRFPYPGPGLYESFYAAPREPRHSVRMEYAQSIPAIRRPELSAPRMRTYVSMMTNGRSHTMTTSVVVSAFHLAFTKLWRLVEEGRCDDAAARMISALTPDDALTPLRADALRTVLALPDGEAIFATLLDLLRISLTYVTNKKGGDQVIETLAAQVERDQQTDGISDLPFTTDLISGGVTIAEIQDIMARAEESPPPGGSFPSLDVVLRNIVATSAISHGVDVDKFNAMFFAGLPSDIAEYIQASSRVGRTHVGFSMFVPTPHSRRDRYVVETHDQFHRFLERMIPPPAVQRWADRAIRRAMPSIFQAYLCAVVEQELFAQAPDDKKESAKTITSGSAIYGWANYHVGGEVGAIRAATEFALEAIGLEGRGSDQIGASTHWEHYQRFVEDCVREIVQRFTARSDASQLSNFWKDNEAPGFRKPMTSLRDVDAGGTILGATRDPYRRRNVHLETVRHVMRVIRGQRVPGRSDLDADPAPIDSEDR